jgi:hypothetical protein
VEEFRNEAEMRSEVALGTLRHAFTALLGSVKEMVGG